MPERCWPVLSPDFAAAARRHAGDVLAMLALFVGVSLLAGRVFRFPFDDEIYTLTIGEQYPGLKMLVDLPRADDVHPPLTNFIVNWFEQFGLAVSTMRLISLAMTGLALALFQLLTMWLVARRNGAAAEWPTRLIAVLLFGLCPLAVSQGDAVRWYPQFALLIALLVTLYLAAGNNAARLYSAAALGLAGSVNFLAGPVALAFVIYRYVLQRAFTLRFDAVFWLVTLVFGSLGAYTASVLLWLRRGALHTQLGNGIVRSALTDLLGFFGGDTLGVGLAWLVVPVIAVAALAIVAAVDRKRASDPVHFLLLMLATAALTALPGFAKPRSFLYLAPAMALLLTLYLDRLLRQGHRVAALAMSVLLVAAAVTGAANVGSSVHPFKRAAVIPYGEVLDFVRANRSGRTLVVSTDPVVVYELRSDERSGALCASFFFDTSACFGDAAYDTVVLIRGHNSRSGDVYDRRFEAHVQRVIGDRHKRAALEAGLDKDAALKTRLTGVSLSEHILAVEVYR